PARKEGKSRFLRKQVLRPHQCHKRIHGPITAIDNNGLHAEHGVSIQGPFHIGEIVCEAIWYALFGCMRDESFSLFVISPAMRIDDKRGFSNHAGASSHDVMACPLALYSSAC